jgi:hypothetical protein
LFVKRIILRFSNIDENMVYKLGSIKKEIVNLVRKDRRQRKGVPRIYGLEDGVLTEYKFLYCLNIFVLDIYPYGVYIDRHNINLRRIRMVKCSNPNCKCEDCQCGDNCKCGSECSTGKCGCGK